MWGAGVSGWQVPSAARNGVAVRPPHHHSRALDRAGVVGVHGAKCLQRCGLGVRACLFGGAAVNVTVYHLVNL